jgi:DNA transformation protein and related proteins
MSGNSEFKEYIIGDALAEIDGVTARAMFGGYGLYKDGIIFGIIADDELFLKVDDTNKEEYEAFDSSPFTYERGNHKKTTMSYWRIPEEILENRERMQELVSDAVRKPIEKKAALSRF